MTAASAATARTAIFGSCASDHFLNPLVRTVIEIPMISSFFGILGNNIWGRLSTDSEQNFAIGKEIFLRSLCGHRLASKECDEFFNLIRETRGWILRPSESEATVPNRLFGPVDRRGDSAKAGRFEDDDAAARNIRVYPSDVVNIGRIRRDVNPGPNAVFPERSGKFGPSGA